MLTSDDKGKSIKKNIYAVVLAGGGGTRLWPLSRTNNPKQFLKLNENISLIEGAINRITQFIPWENVIVVTNKKYSQTISKLFPKIKKNHIIAEPQKKDTALAMLVGSIFASKLNDDAIIVNVASDHTIEDQDKYEKTILAGALYAKQTDSIVAIGIVPTSPHTGYGYIKIGQEIKKMGKDLPVFKVEDFTEKPSLPVAIAYLSTGKYFWNANIYIWSTKTILKTYEKYMPSMYKTTFNKLKNVDIKNFNKSLEDIYRDSESISIDYAISEKADNLVLIPGDFGWNDIGSWSTVYKLSKKDLTGNALLTHQDRINILTIKSHNNLVHSNNRLIALYNVNDLIIIDTKDVLMICNMKDAQKVKDIVNKLKEENKKEYL